MLDCVLVVFYAALMFLYDVAMTAVGIGLALLNVAAIRLVSSGAPTPAVACCRSTAS